LYIYIYCTIYSANPLLRSSRLNRSPIIIFRCSLTLLGPRSVANQRCTFRKQCLYSAINRYGMGCLRRSCLRMISATILLRLRWSKNFLGL